MCNAVEKLWESVYDYGFYVRNNGVDGLHGWNNIKVLLEKYNQQIEWLPEALTRYDEITSKFNIKDDEKNDDWTNEQKQEWEITHFFFQHARIPEKNKKEKATLLRFMQIAYNAGQLSSEWNNKYNTEDRKEYYQMHNLKSYLSYVSYNVITKINESLYIVPPVIAEVNSELDKLRIQSQRRLQTQTQKGGTKNFLNKYKKYNKKINMLKSTVN